MAIRALIVATAFLCSVGFAYAQDTKPHAFEDEIQHMLDADAKHPPAQGGIVFVGSSSIRMWTSLAKDFPHHHVVNRGFGGSELADSVYFANRIVIPLKPKMVIVFAGTNDINNGKKAEDVSQSFDSLVTVIRKELPQTRIAFISITPAPSRRTQWQEVVKANAMIRKSCMEGDNLAYIDTFPFFLNEDGSGKPELFIADQLHLNPKGYAIWANVVAPFLP